MLIRSLLSTCFKLKYYGIYILILILTIITESSYKTMLVWKGIISINRYTDNTILLYNNVQYYAIIQYYLVSLSIVEYFPRFCHR